MNTDIHHNDDQYRKAYQRLEAEPSPEVWNKVMADLDNRDAKYYQKKLIGWKRFSFILLLLLGTITLTGILYVVNKKPAVTMAGIKDYGSGKPIDKTIPDQPYSNDSIATTQNKNINQKEIYAAAKRPKSNSDTIVTTVWPTAPVGLDEVPEPIDTNIRKQHLEQIQNTSVTTPVIRQKAAATNKVVVNKRQPASAKNNRVLTTREKLPVYVRNDLSGRHNPVLFFTAEKKLVALYRTKADVDSELAGGYNNEPNISALFLASGLQNFTNIANKETIDSNVADQVNTIAALNRKKSMEQEADAATGKGAVHIAKVFRPHIQLTGYSSFDVTQYHLDNDEHGNNSGQPPPRRGNKHDIEERESSGFSFSTGLMARLQVTPKLSFKTGLSYSSTSINIQPQTLYADRDDNQHIAYKFITSSGYGYVKPSGGAALVVGDSTAANRSHQQLKYLSVPVMFGYTAYTGKHLTVIPSVGAAANFLLSARVQTEINAATTKEPVRITKLDGSKPWYPSLIADAEVQYRLKRNWRITLLPSLRYAISPITQNSAVKTLPYSFGIGAGITYHF